MYLAALCLLAAAIPATFASPDDITVQTAVVKAQLDSGSVPGSVELASAVYTEIKPSAVLLPGAGAQAFNVHANIEATSTGSSFTGFLCKKIGDLPTTDDTARACLTGAEPYASSPDSRYQANQAYVSGLLDAYLPATLDDSFFLAITGEGLTSDTDKNNYFRTTADFRAVGPLDTPHTALRHQPQPAPAPAPNTNNTSHLLGITQYQGIGATYATVKKYTIPQLHDLLIGELSFAGSATPAAFNLQLSVADSGIINNDKPTTYQLTIHSSSGDATSGANPLADPIKANAPVFTFDHNFCLDPSLPSIWFRLELLTDTNQRPVIVGATIIPNL